MSKGSIWLIDGTLSGADTPVQSRPRNNGNEKVLHIHQGSNTGASPSDCFLSYSEHSLRCSRYIIQPQPTGLQESDFYTNDNLTIIIHPLPMCTTTSLTANLFIFKRGNRLVIKKARRSLRNIIVNMLVWGLEVCDFEFQSCSYVYFHINFLEKGRNSLIYSAMR